MMYRERFVAVVKCDGKILREQGDSVFLPFGSEYSLLFKNLESRKALVKVSIDGSDVLNGRALLLPANSEIELERFVDGDMRRGNRFKFIQKTQQIVDHRGDRVDDGLIRVEFQFELYKPVTVYENYYLWPMLYPLPQQPTTYKFWCGSNTPIYSSSSGAPTSDKMNLTYNINVQYSNISQDEGITVKGSESNQSFEYGLIGQLEPNSNVIIIRLRGIKDSGLKIDEPITVQTKLICPTCGKKASSNSKYCSRCGTFLN